jgi:hypothetical protein
MAAGMSSQCLREASHAKYMRKYGVFVGLSQVTILRGRVCKTVGFSVI